jgi:catechol 2,3-dioxygenase-like lactoylglutathione lyase family enzyme
MSSAEISPVDSVVFRTRDLALIRQWYSSVLGLKVARLDDGREDADGRYVNFRSGKVLIGFETGAEVDRARFVFMTGDLEAARRELAKKGVIPSEGQSDWMIIRDPESREIIVQKRT